MVAAGVGAAGSLWPKMSTPAEKAGRIGRIG